MSQRTEILKISLFFLILNTSDNSYESIITHMFQQRKIPSVGPLSLVVLCVAYTLALLVSPIIKISLKKQLLIPVSAYILNFTLSLMSTFCEQKASVYLLVCSGSFLSGFASGFQELGQARYMHMICQIYDGQKERGRLFAISDAFYAFSVILGAFTTLIGLGFFDTKVYFFILIGLGFISLIFGLLMLKAIEEIGNSRILQLQSLSEISQLRKLQLIRKVTTQVKEEIYRLNNNQQNFLENLKKIVAFVPYIRCLIPYLLIISVIVIVKTNFFSSLIPNPLNPQLRQKLIGVGQIVGGIGAILGSYAGGYLFDEYGAVWTGRKGSILFCFCCWLHILALQIQNLTLSLVTIFIWGYTKAILESLCITICSKHYEGRAEPLVIFKIFITLGYTIIQGFLASSDNKIHPNYFILFSLLTIPSYYYLGKVTQAYGSSLKPQLQQQFNDKVTDVPLTAQ